jgi:hypothetical protein
MQQQQRDWSGCEIIEFNNADYDYTPEFIACELFEEPVEDVKAILEYAQKKGWLVRLLN